MLTRSTIAVAALIALLGACSLSVEGNTYSPGGGGGGSGSSVVGAGAGSSVTSTSTSTSTSATTSASSANTGLEDCFDNEDTDGDGAVDCDDPDCAPAAACAPVPKDWVLVRISEADPSEPAGECADGSTTGELYLKDPAGPPACTRCECSDPEATCTAPEIACYFNSNSCGGGMPNFKIRATDGECVDLTEDSDPDYNVNIPSGEHSSGSCRLSAAPLSQSEGSCSMSGGEVVDAPLWGSAVLVCPEEAEAGGCEGGARCVPTPEGSICIARGGDHKCPSEWPAKTVAYLNGDDARSCTACECDVGCAGGEYIVRDSADCTDYHDAVTVNSADCVQVPDIFDFDDTALNPTVGAPVVTGCMGGTGQGQVDPQDQQTICCRD